MDLYLRLTKKLKNLEDNRFMLAVSGGLDSMALLHLFCHFRDHFDFSFQASYVHHGPSPDPLQEDYRFNAWNFVKKYCEKEGIEFFSNYSGEDPDEFSKKFPQILSSESDFREYRQNYFAELKKQLSWDWLVLAHHRDDLLETRLMRLVRGVGSEHLKAMSFAHDGILRPLLDVSREELKQLLRSENQGWLEDPSNEDPQYFRNWLRKHWLPQLEEKRPGSLQSLSRSLDLILEEKEGVQSLPEYQSEGEILISVLLTLSLSDKRQALANYMWNQGLKNYGLSHINEVLKRLDTEKKSYTFQLLGRQWQVDAGRLKVLGLG